MPHSREYSLSSSSSSLSSSSSSISSSSSSSSHHQRRRSRSRSIDQSLYNKQKSKLITILFYRNNSKRNHCSKQAKRNKERKRLLPQRRLFCFISMGRRRLHQCEFKAQEHGKSV